MDFDTFKDELAKGVQERLEALYDRKYSVETHTVEKMNETYEAITVKPEDGEIGVNIKIDKAYAEYNDGRSFDMIVRQVSGFAAEALDNRPGFDLNAIQDYSVMKTKLSMEVVSAERNAQLLETVPHKNMEDMAIVYRFVLDTVEAGRGSILVTNKMLDNYGITAEQLHNDAMEIAPEVRPAVIKGMSEVLADMMGAEQAEMLGLGPVQDEPIFVATVEDQTQGAGILAYQNFMDEAAEKLGGEILGLRWEDVDFEKKTISINHSLVYYKDEETGKCTMRIHLPKTESGIRIIPMLDVVKEALEMAKDEQELEGAEQPTVDGLTGFIFLNQFGDVLNQSSVNRAIKRILEYYNYEEDLAAKKEGREPVLLPKFSCHVLRHTFATRLCRVCTNLKVIQYIMGHKSIETTMDVYAEATGDKNKEVFEVLSEALADLF